MYTDTLVVIPARGGSKGIPRKNVKTLGQKPLIHYSIEIAQTIFPNNQICVSTDDDEIKSISEQTGITIPFIRPATLATDTATTYDVLIHAIHHYEQQGHDFKKIMLLQPTSPFRKTEHLQQAISDFEQYQPEMIVSVVETTSNPYYVLVEENEAGFLEKSKKGNFTRRQDCPVVYEYNGSIYIIDVETLKKKQISEFSRVKKFVMEVKYAIDLDTPEDWEFAEYLLKKSQI